MADSGGGDGPTDGSTWFESRDWMESRRCDACVEYLEVEEARATPGENDGGGLTGAASPGDVMDTEGIRTSK